MISAEILRVVLRPEVVIKRLVFRNSWERVLADWVAFFIKNYVFPVSGVREKKTFSQ
jgi:hypothetical protein